MNTNANTTICAKTNKQNNSNIIPFLPSGCPGLYPCN